MYGANLDISILPSSSISDLVIALIVLSVIKLREESGVKSVPNSALKSFKLDIICIYYIKFNNYNLKKGVKQKGVSYGKESN